MLTIVLLMVVVVVLTRSFSALAEGRRPETEPPPGPGSYGYMQSARGLPTDVPLSPASRRAIESDITHLGIELRELDFDIDGDAFTDAARRDHATASKAYEDARLALQGARSDSEATHITRIIEEGRHCVGRVRARVLGKPLPARRPPCFFDPAHGPSSEDVLWTPPGGTTLPVPACDVDISRLRLGAAPRIRMVEGDHGAVPYWEDSRHAAWARGYYSPWLNDPALARMAHGPFMIRGFSILMGMQDD